MDLKQGLEFLKSNKTFKCILSTLRSIGIFLNGAPVKGFQIEYLAKVCILAFVICVLEFNSNYGFDSVAFAGSRSQGHSS